MAILKSNRYCYVIVLAVLPEGQDSKLEAFARVAGGLAPTHGSVFEGFDLGDASSRISRKLMRKILESEGHVQVPPVLYSDPFYRITYLIKEEIRKYKWLEVEKGRKISWEIARKEWTKAYGQRYEKFLVESLSFSEGPSSERPAVNGDDSKDGIRVRILPFRMGG
jgi:hypothetical protein